MSALIQHFRCWSYLLLLPTLLCSLGVQAQTRGIGEITQDAGSQTMPRTYALVVGISNYLNIPKIPQLYYPSQDALDFAALLQHTGTCRKQDITLLREDSATAANVFLCLKTLVRDAKAGERVIIYFAGHGDVDNDINSGFLLTYSCINGIYDGGDAISLQRLQAYIDKLAEKTVNVLLITDACRSGNLTGNKETLTTLKGMHNVVKLMSCRANELSAEKFYKIYGVGHGVFTRYLLEGMAGMADRNNDGLVNLKELQRYLEDNMEEETEGKQNPVVEGDQMMPLVKVDSTVKNAMIAVKKGDPNNKAVAMVDRNRAVFSAAQTNTPDEDTLIAHFYQLVKARKMVSPKGGNAYETLLAARKQHIKPELLQNLSWDLAALLENDAQKWLNIYLKADHFYSTLRKKHTCGDIISKLDATLDLLGTDDMRYNEIKAKKLFFETYSINLKEHAWEFGKGEQLIKQADSLMPNMAYIQNVMGIMEAWGSPNNATAAMEHFKKASHLAPKWIYPPVNIAWLYIDQNNFAEAEKYLKIAEGLDSLGDDVWLVYGDMYAKKKQYNQSQLSYERAITLEQDNVDAYFGLGNIFTAQKDFGRAENNYLKALQIDAEKPYTYCQRARMYATKNDLDKAWQTLQNGLKIDTLYPDTYAGLARLSIAKQDYAAAATYCQKALAIDGLCSNALYYSAAINAYQGNTQEALSLLEKSFHAGFDDWDELANNKAFNLLKADDKFKEMLSKYQR